MKLITGNICSQLLLEIFQHNGLCFMDWLYTQVKISPGIPVGFWWDSNWENLRSRWDKISGFPEIPRWDFCGIPGGISVGIPMWDPELGSQMDPGGSGIKFQDSQRFPGGISVGSQVGFLWESRCGIPNWDPRWIPVGAGYNFGIPWDSQIISIRYSSGIPIGIPEGSRWDWDNFGILRDSWVWSQIISIRNIFYWDNLQMNPLRLV